MTLVAALVQLATGAAARVFAVSVATSLAQSAVLAILTSALPAPASASAGGHQTPRPIPGARTRTAGRGRNAPGPHGS